jgi:hypothetical protein
MSHRGEYLLKGRGKIGVRGLKIKGKGESGMDKPAVSDARQKRDQG